MLINNYTQKVFVLNDNNWSDFDFTKLLLNDVSNLLKEGYMIILKFPKGLDFSMHLGDVKDGYPKNCLLYEGTNLANREQMYDFCTEGLLFLSAVIKREINSIREDDPEWNTQLNIT